MRAQALALIAFTLALALPAAARAHVTILPERARPGETVDFTFRMQNERDDAATVRLDLFLPPGVPAEVAPHPGWTSTVLPTGEVRWTAEEGSALPPGRSADFKVRLGPLPDREEIVFKSLQHYADGDIVRWIQTGGPEDERPAAVLTLAIKGTSGGGPSPLIYIGLGFASVVLAAILILRLTR